MILQELIPVWGWQLSEVDICHSFSPFDEKYSNILAIKLRLFFNIYDCFRASRVVEYGHFFRQKTDRWQKKHTNLWIMLLKNFVFRIIRGKFWIARGNFNAISACILSIPMYVTSPANWHRAREILSNNCC